MGDLSLEDCDRTSNRGLTLFRVMWDVQNIFLKKLKKVYNIRVKNLRNTIPEISMDKYIYIFDMDGVISQTSKIHFECWKEAFKKVNQKYVVDEKIYKKYFDGVTREKAIENYLTDMNEKNKVEIKKTVSENKNKIFNEVIDKLSVEDIIYKDNKLLIQKLRKEGAQMCLATSSKNASRLLKKIKYENIFEIIIDGNELEEKKLNSKPEPDIFNLCIEKIRRNKEEIIIIEDSISGVEAAIKSYCNKVIWIQRMEFTDIENEKMKSIGKNKLKIIHNMKEVK